MRRYAAIEVTWPIRPDEDCIDRLHASLDEGALSAIDDQGQVWRAFFTSGDARDRALASLAGVPAGAEVRAIDVADEQWAERSQAALRPIRVGRILVAPPWRVRDAATREPGVDHVIVINPSMGFGTGHHASTRRCLSLLQAAPLAGRSVLDVGTGSGVLAIAAWKLGAGPVDAVDSDADAVASARDNLTRNRADGAVQLIEGDLDAVDMKPGGYGVVLANLTGATLIRHAADLASLGAPGSWLIASGIELDETAAVAGALSAAGWREIDREMEDGWTGLRLERAATSPTASTGS